MQAWKKEEQERGRMANDILVTSQHKVFKLLSEHTKLPVRFNIQPLNF